MDMKRYLGHMVTEIRKPLEALKLTVIFSIQFLALLFLRVVLWMIFFLLPIGLLLLLAFHTVTHQVKRMIPNHLDSSNLQEARPLQGKSASVNPLNLKAMNDDLRFW